MNRVLLALGVIASGAASAIDMKIDGNVLNVSRHSIEFDISNGDVFVQTDAGATQCVAGAQEPPTLVLTANPESISPGESTEIEWATGNATTCDAWGGGNTGYANIDPFLPSSGFIAQNLSQTTTFGMTCQNPHGSVSDTVQVTVGNGNTGGVDDYPGDGVFPEGCSTNPSPGTSWQHSNYLWLDTFGTWPGVGSEQWWIDTGKWTAMYFETEDVSYSSGKIRFNEAAASGPRGNRVKAIKISSCPGDFSEDVAGQTCRFDGPTTNGQLRWESGDGLGLGLDFRCTLERGKGYYVNVIFGLADNPAASTCYDQSSGAGWPECELLMIADPD